MPERRNPPAAARRSMAGVSLIELMIAMTLGLMVLAALVSVFANSSASRNEMERSARQIENGRYAMELLSEDLRHSGFYGETSVNATVSTTEYPGTVPPGAPAVIQLPAALPDPCSTVPADWVSAMLIAVQGYNDGAGLPGTCAIANRRAGTDILVIRRVSTCEAGVGTCPAAVNGQPYLQVSKCVTETPLRPFSIGLKGTAGFTLTVKDCATLAGLRQYYVRIYFISDDNGAVPPVAIPTLKRMDFNGAGFTETPLVEGIEAFKVEYGIDVDGDGAPDGYTADPTNWTGPPGCAAADCNAVKNWANVVSTRIYILARNIESSPNYVDAKTYTLGSAAAGGVVTLTPGLILYADGTGGAAYRHHVYSSLVRVVNAAERRDLP